MGGCPALTFERRRRLDLFAISGLDRCNGFRGCSLGDNRIRGNGFALWRVRVAFAHVGALFFKFLALAPLFLLAPLPLVTFKTIVGLTCHMGTLDRLRGAIQASGVKVVTFRGVPRNDHVGNYLVRNDQVVRGRTAITAGNDLELDLLALLKATETGPFDDGNMDKDVFIAAFWFDKAKSL